MFATLVLCAAVSGLTVHAAQVETIQRSGLYAAALGLVPAEAAASKTGAKIQLVSVEKSILEDTNAERVRYGLPPLELDEELMQSARQHARWMAQRQSLQHTSAPVAENIAMGQQDSKQALASWMRSSGHRANILNPGHRRIGVAAHPTSGGLMFWCQQFRP